MPGDVKMLTELIIHSFAIYLPFNALLLSSIHLIAHSCHQHSQSKKLSLLTQLALPYTRLASRSPSPKLRLKLRPSKATEADRESAHSAPSERSSPVGSQSTLLGSCPTLLGSSCPTPPASQLDVEQGTPPPPPTPSSRRGAQECRTQPRTASLLAPVCFFFPHTFHCTGCATVNRVCMLQAHRLQHYFLC